MVDPFPVRISGRQKIFSQGGLENGFSQSEQVRGLFLIAVKAEMKSVPFLKNEYFFQKAVEYRPLSVGTSGGIFLTGAKMGVHFDTLCPNK